MAELLLRECADRILNFLQGLQDRSLVANQGLLLASILDFNLLPRPSAVKCRPLNPRTESIDRIRRVKEAGK